MIIMKTKFLFAMCAIAASFALISCSDEQLLTEDIIEPEVPYTGPVTVFSSVAETPQNSPFGPNRTSAARNGSKFPFYWTKNDRIWVKNTDNKFYESHTVRVNTDKDEPTEKVAAGYFDIHGSFDAESYQVFYLGQVHNVSEGTDAAHGTKEPDVYVTIAKEQGQMKVEHMDHFGVAGDCGEATAYKQTDGTYQFVLNHKASYLAIYPKKGEGIDNNVTIDKLEITADGTDLAGDFHFSDGSLIGKTAENNGKKSQTIYFKTGTGEYEYGFPLEATNDKEKGIYVVIPPGTHTLSLKFYLFDEYHRKAEVTKTYSSYVYKENTFVNLKPTLYPDFPNELVYENVWYQWDAQYPYDPQYWSTNQYNDVSAPNSASYSCKYMPNANELWWYIKNGDVRWDGTTTYTVKYKKREGNVFDGFKWNVVEETLYGGIWIKRKAAILAGEGGMTKCGHASHGGNGPYMCEDHCYYSKAINGQNVPGWYDFRVDDNAHADFNRDYSPNYHAGKPTENIEDYFFLPALGYFDSGQPHFVENESYDNTTQAFQTGYYWARNPAPANGNQKLAYYLMFNANGLHVNETIGTRNKGFVAGDEWFH